MAAFTRKLFARQRSNKALWAAIVLSIGLHLLIFSPNIFAPNTIEPAKPYPVIHAQLRQETPQQAQLKQVQPEQTQAAEETAKETAKKTVEESNTATAEQSTADKSVVSTQASAVNQNKPSESIATKSQATKKQPQTFKAETEPKQAQDEAEEAGLVISKDLLSSDPFEREYQQLVLAHLRKTLLAPKHYSGSVRVEIRFSYRQIATDVRVVISSGNPFFDEWAVKAILVANPFPPVPPELGDNYVFRPTLKVGP